MIFTGFRANFDLVMAWNRLEHSIFHLFSELGLSKKKLLVGFSGGVDSVVLLHLLNQLKRPIGYEILAVHVHHGGISEYRDMAAKFCADWCEKNAIDFRLEKASADCVLKNEEELRTFRYGIFKKLFSSENCDFISTAHQQEDLLETRLLRLIRGTGLNGLKSMSIFDGQFLRPFLSVSKEALLQQARNKNLTWIDDPSNQDLGPMRNWIRNHWFKELENKSPGALQSLSRSLELILEQAEHQILPENLWSDTEGLASIHKAIFLSMTEKQQKEALAQYMISLGAQNFTQNHILEVLKHLDKPQNDHKFIVAQCEWRINAKQILAYPIKSAQ